MDCSSSRVSNTAAGPEALRQSPGDPVHAALAGHVLPEHEQAGPGGQGVGQRRVDRLGQGEAVGRSRGGARRRPVPPRGFRGPAGPGPDPPGMKRREGLHHLGGAGQPAAPGHLGREAEDTGPRRLVARGHPGRGQDARRDQQPGRAEQRVGGQVGGERGRLPVAALHIRARVPAEPHHVQVQERGGAPLADPGRGGQRRVVHGGQVGPVGVEVPDARHGLGGRPDPSGRRPHADAQSVVLDHHQQRQREMLEGAVGSGVDRAGGGGVVEGRVAEAGGHDRVRGPSGGLAEPGRPVQGEGQAEGAGQVRGDRRGLRDDVQLLVAEHLVAAAGDGLVHRGHQPEQDIADPVTRWAGLLAPGQVEGAGAVVQQGRVGDPQRRGDAGVALVPG